MQLLTQRKYIELLQVYIYIFYLFCLFGGANLATACVPFSLFFLRAIYNCACYGFPPNAVSKLKEGKLDVALVCLQQELAPLR